MHKINRTTRSLRRLTLWLLAASPLLTACSKDPDLVVYVSLDMEFSAPLIAEFEAETGLKVRAEYDTEASKTVGLVRRIVEEAKNPRCDVFWNNEIAQTVNLAHLGHLTPYDSPVAADIPAEFRDPDRRWTGFGARARILIVNTELVPDPSEIDSMWDLLDPKWRGQACIARPLTGTTLTHAAALYLALGNERAEEYLGAIAKGQHLEPPVVNVASSNGQTARLVREGVLAFGWTDTDDFAVAKATGAPVIAVYPDQKPGPGGEPPLGTLLIPNTVCIPKGAPHLESAKRFVDWVLSRKMEERLAFSKSAQIPVRPDVPRPDSVRSDFVHMQISYVALGQQIANRTQRMQAMFLDQ
ncbi:MAG: extracellular solute-binding protein [Planctomycetes bacterium]|nr:extracellular solute-binding protein [Planctomycetota bacterium]MCB9909259.1 extracellular solute-binding protein [Planctomycetota bacterium]HPF13313.1 extracellular solute-binding protein [Planctomycetota bacterium]HRV82007.1 extracellular solute-binding protein [Planctomycetota bacterium]